MVRTLFILTTDPERTWELAQATPPQVRVESRVPRVATPPRPVPGLLIDHDYLLLDREPAATGW